MTDHSPEKGTEYVVIPKEDGEEERFEILFTFEHDENGNNYMVVVPEEENEGESQDVFAFRYEEDGENLELFLIEDDKEWDMVEEVFNTIMEESDEGLED
ncbi:DUF1292 domain-containing protein [Mechercharimyces sp. CAU 1602]|uniref:DUF1292 domain-containing protein n=1 Tax=Mechercharimyces sp. CAU 1602 TaxID=2973933 RepID=UPI0021636427|nr:DUF1292 domain-containing protein [Mechercharimyces sp. CAU 1602]MCS1350264.1 DUF1292 domain-containing protein [Mechercharimyces sp. CAU 1602]